MKKKSLNEHKVNCFAALYTRTCIDSRCCSCELNFSDLSSDVDEIRKNKKRSERFPLNYVAHACVG